MKYEEGVALGGMRVDEHEEVVNHVISTARLMGSDAVPPILAGLAVGAKKLGKFSVEFKTEGWIIAVHYHDDGKRTRVIGRSNDESTIVSVINLLTPHLDEFRTADKEQQSCLKH